MYFFVELVARESIRCNASCKNEAIDSGVLAINLGAWLELCCYVN